MLSNGVKASYQITYKGEKKKTNQPVEEDAPSHLTSTLKECWNIGIME